MAAVPTPEEGAEAPRPPAPSLSDVAPAVLQKYFGEFPNTFLTQHHIRSYEAWDSTHFPCRLCDHVFGSGSKLHSSIWTVSCVYSLMVIGEPCTPA